MTNCYFHYIFVSYPVYVSCINEGNKVEVPEIGLAPLPIKVGVPGPPGTIGNYASDMRIHVP